MLAVWWRIDRNNFHDPAQRRADKTDSQDHLAMHHSASNIEYSLRILVHLKADHRTIHKSDDRRLVLESRLHVVNQARQPFILLLILWAGALVPAQRCKENLNKSAI